MSVLSIQDSNALLLYRVGPVRMCSPTMPVEAVIMPPKITVPPGANVAEPGVFKSLHGIVRLVDLRVRFGVDDSDRSAPGKIVIVEVEGGHAGFWVDEIEDVIGFPATGWSQVSSHIPKDIFTRTLMHKDNIRLYADFDQLDKLKSSGYLRKHIEVLKKAKEETLADKTHVESMLGKNIKAEKYKNVEMSEIDIKEPENIPVKEMGADEKSIDAVHFLEVNKIEEMKKTDRLSAKGKKNNAQAVYSHSAKSFDKIKSVSANLNSRNLKREEVGRENVSSKTIETGVEEIPQTLLHSLDVKPKVIKVNELRVEEQVSGIGFYVLGACAVIFLLLMYFMMDVSFFEDKVGGKVERASREYKKTDVHVLTSSNLEKEAVGVDEEGVSKKTEVVKASESVVGYTEKEGSVKISKSDEGMLIVVNEYVDEVKLSVFQKRYAEEENKTGIVDDDGQKKPASKAVDQVGVNIDDSVLSSSMVSNNSSNEMKMLDEKNDQLVGSKKIENSIFMVKMEVEADSVGEVSIQGEDQLANESRAQSVVKKTEAKKPMSRRYVHRVVKGDTLWHIAKRYVNNPWRYPELAKLSDIKNPDLIYPGDKVTIIINYQLSK